MPIRIPGESDEEARAREREQRVGRPGMPTPQLPPAPQPVPTPQPTPPSPDATEPHKPYRAGPPVSAGTIDEYRSVYLPEKYAEPGDIKVSTEGERWRILDKEPDLEGGKYWRYKVQDARIFQGWDPTAEFGTPDNYGKAIVDWVQGFEARGKTTSSGELIGAPTQFPPPPANGRPQDLMDYYQNLFNIEHVLGAFRRHLEDNVPEAVDAYHESFRATTDEGRRNNTALSPSSALLAALNDYAEKYPDDYVQRIGSDEGFAELGEMAMARFTTKPGKEYTILELGDFLTTAEEEYLPDVPFLKESVIRATDIFTDPILVGSMFIPGLAPAGMLSKARLLAEIAAGGAVGEQAASEIGIPESVGGIAGMIGAPIATRAGEGFVKAVLKSGLENARIRPVPGEPATDILIRNGEMLEVADIQKAMRVTQEAAPEGRWSFAESVDDFGDRSIIARDASGKTVGHIGWEEGDGGAFVHMIKVDEPLRRQGLGRALTNQMAQSAQTRGIQPARIGGTTTTPEGAALESAMRPAPEAAQGPTGIPGVTISELPGSPAEVRAGRHTIIAADDAGNELGRLQWREPRGGQDAGHIIDVVSQQEGRGIGSALVQEALDQMAVKGITRATGDLTSEGGVRLFNRFKAKFQDLKGKSLSTEDAAVQADTGLGPTMELDTPMLPSPIAGGATGQDLLDFFRRLINIHIERPEAQDILRKIARGMGHIPGARRVVEVINRQALAESPTLKGAFGFKTMEQYDNSIRDFVMSQFRGQRVPFRENSRAQIWLPKTASAAEETLPGRAISRLLRREGDWIAVGDVFESVWRGESKYLNRLTPNQLQFVKKITGTLEMFAQQTADVTGEQFIRRQAHWPRMVIDLPTKRWTVGGGGQGRPSFMFGRVFEEQQVAIQDYGIHYKPGILDQAETFIDASQRINRKVTLHKYLQEEGIIDLGRAPRATETIATDLVPTMKNVRPGVISIEHLNEVQSLIGPPSRNPLITIPAKINGILRLALAGVLDTGVGALQLSSLLYTNPKAWGEAMGRSLYNMIVEPKQYYRYIATQPVAREYVRYGGNVGLTTEFFEATGMGAPFRLPSALETPVNVATFPLRTLVSRMETEFSSALAYGRILAFDALRGPATAPGPLLTALGARPLTGQAYHDEMFRLARFVDTMVGQPSMKGIIPTTQQQFESAWVWFAPRYTRSLLGTAAYMAGRGYTPAVARKVMGQMLLGGIMTYAGIVAGIGKLQGKSAEEIQQDLITGLNPLNGKKFMSIKVGNDYFGQGGVYRAGFSAIGTLADVENWNDLESTREKMLNNPFVRIWRTRTTPLSGTLTDFVSEEDFIGHEIKFWELVDNPQFYKEYAQDHFAPFTLNAVLQEGGWERRTARGIAEFLGLRTSPETPWEAMQPIMNKVAEERFGVPFDGLEHNTPAEDYVRNHPSVMAVEEGSVLPLLKSKEEKQWELYRTLRDGIRDKWADKKEDLDAAFINGHITARDYKDEYRVIQASEFSELEGMRETLYASTGFDVEVGEEAPEGTVDAALHDYFEVKVEDYMDKKTQQVDWDSFFADRDAALAKVPEEYQSLVADYLTRHQGQVAKDLRKKFDEIIRPSHYFDMREQIAESIGVSLTEVEQAVIGKYREEGRRAAPSDIGNDVEDVLNFLMQEKYGDRAPTIYDLKQLMREQNPRLDVELYRQGYVTTVRSLYAIKLANELKESSPELGYFTPKLADDVKKSFSVNTQ